MKPSSIITAAKDLGMVLGLLITPCLLATADTPPPIQGQENNPALAASITERRERTDAFFASVAAFDKEGIKKALQQNPELLTSTDRYGSTALTNALGQRNEELARFLLELGADVNQPTGYGDSPLNMAIEYMKPDLVKLLMEKGAQVSVPSRSGYYIPLFSAVRKDNTDMLKSLLAAGADIKARDKDGNTVLHKALQYGAPNLEVVKMLLASGVDVNARNDEGKTPIFKIRFLMTTSENYAAALTLLVNAGADVNARAVNGNTALMAPLVDEGIISSCNEIRCLLEKGADPNLANQRGDLPLHQALRTMPEGDWIEAKNNIKSLIEKTDVSKHDSRGLSPLVIALEQRLQFARDAILEKLKTPPETDAFFDAVAQNDTSALQTMAQVNKALVGTRLPDGTTPLHMAALWSATDSVKTLVELGADIDARDASGRTPLLRAVRKEREQLKIPDVNITVKALLARHADPGLMDVNGGTALHLAISLYDLPVTETLIEAQVQRGISLDLRNKDGQTALLHLLEIKAPAASKTLQLLIGKGADINARGRKGMTVLCQAARTDQTEIMPQLLKSGVEINAISAEGANALAYAVDGNAAAAARLLIEKGASLELPAWPYSLIERAVNNENMALIQLLLDKGADINAHPRSERTPLCRAVLRGNKEITAFLLRNGADPNLSGYDKKTPLQLARENGRKEIADILLKNGAK